MKPRTRWLAALGLCLLGATLVIAGCSAPVKTLKLKVTPESASIYVDGKLWRSATGEVQKIPLDYSTIPEHQIQVVKPGYRPERLTFTFEEVPDKVYPLTLQ